MTLLLVLAVWVLLAVVGCAFLSVVIRGVRHAATPGRALPEVSLPQQRAHQDVRSTATAGGRG